MPRPSWKGNPPFPNELYERSLTSSKDTYKEQPVVIFRRNFKLSSDAISNLDGVELKIYNGYDLFKKKINSEFIWRNMSQTVLTREVNVKHKVKLSKNARKNLQLKANKKKIVTLAGTAKNKKTTSKIKKK